MAAFDLFNGNSSYDSMEPELFGSWDWRSENITKCVGAVAVRDVNKTMMNAYHALLLFITFIIIFSMTTAITSKDVKTILTKRRWDLIIGCLLQIFLAPALYFGFALALKLDDKDALGLVVFGCCPGAPLLTLAVLWTRFDVTLRFV